MASPYPQSDEEIPNEAFLERTLSEAAQDFAIRMHEQTESIGSPLDTVEEQNMGLVDIESPIARDLSSFPSRPLLRRDSSIPAPLQPPPPAPPSPGLGNDTGDPTDSLSLAQLRNLVKEIPRVEPTPYAFVYADAASLPEELEEWFNYTVEERARILKCQSSFAQEWGQYNGWVFMEASGEEGASLDWINTTAEDRRGFVVRLFQSMNEKETDSRLRVLEALVYLVLGCWLETAGLTKGGSDQPCSGKGKQKSEEPEHDMHAVEPVTSVTIPLSPRSKALEEQFSKSNFQLQWIKNNVDTLFECGGLQPIFNLVRESCFRECMDDPARESITTTQKEAEQRETWCALTIFYFCLEVSRTCEESKQKLAMRAEILRLEPNILTFFCDVTNKLRWDDAIQLHFILYKILLLIWKSILVSFGGIADVETAKASFREDFDENDKPGRPVITASPLDYHAFRQEISSKYPAYNPPPPLFPLESDEKSILPPLRVNPTKPTNGTATTQTPTHGHSILHQPVHIATPAPSPPPSPAGSGKGGKKQNYQTNQLFPFLYPPLDETSNKLGGKGSTDLQDALVGRKWTGSDIPASILEAAELFSKRMRATRSMKQLWAERVAFMKFERGWEDIDSKKAVDTRQQVDPGDDDITDVESLDLDQFDLGNEDEPVIDAPVQEEGGKEEQLAQQHWSLISDGSVEDRLGKVEDFYKSGLPHLQSLIMVLLKTILANVTALITQTANGQNGAHGNFTFPEAPNGTSAHKPETNGVMNGMNLDVAHVSTEELDAIRTQEVTAKAASGILVLLLKWFRVSHILKFEYLTQLLVDANYIPMILKLLQTQEIERIVNYRSDREDLNFFYFCRAHSRVGLDELSEEPPHDLSDSSSDGAAPPPVIKRHRDEPPVPPPPLVIEASQSSGLPISNPFTPGTPAGPSFPPEVDELGMPTSEMPPEPITTFSWRNFFSSINFLRILQKCCKGKAHRNLMLVTYKSSAILKKSLKVPQPELRLYTLKLFKGQVPFCGRKWRQSNMRVITAVYLHCRPELRDEWLVSADVDGEVEMAVPMEQALRALTHWFNLKNYPDSMGATKGVLEEEQDFFVRELDKLDWGELEAQGLGMDGENVDGGWARDEGPLQLEGW